MRSIPSYLKEKAGDFPDLPALRFAEGGERRVAIFREMFDDVDRFARGLVASGVREGDRVYHVADNSERWIVADLGILAAGAVSVPRGADTTPDESKYILEHSGATAVVAANGKILSALPVDGSEIGTRVVMDGEGEPGVTTWEQLLETGREGTLPETSGELATIVYTSGTTGKPKGVMLTHENILHNVRALPPLIHVTPADRFLSVLPSWHMFERTVEYAVLASGATLTYSSLRTLKDDLREEKPTFMAAVPRLYQAVREGFFTKLEQKSPFARTLARFLLNRALNYSRARGRWSGRFEDPRSMKGNSKIGALIGTILSAPLGMLGRRVVGGPVREAMGGRMRGAISGGGMLSLGLDTFYDALGVTILVGYGLTETSPVAACRIFEENVLGSIGRALTETELRVVDQRGRELPPRTAGELEVRGPQVMSGYYHDEEKTKQTFRPDGWFRTGDLCALTERGDVLFTGRAKETIVLVGGENIEPRPIESRILESPFVKQVIVVGQDRKNLAALVVPELERAEKEAKARGSTVENLVREEFRILVSHASGFKSRELVSRIAVLEEEFAIENGLMTRTMKLKRNEILAKYADVIDGLYARA